MMKSISEHVNSKALATTEKTPFITTEEAIALSDSPVFKEFEKWSSDACFGAMGTDLELTALQLKVGLSAVSNLARLGKQGDVSFKSYTTGETERYAGQEGHGQFLDHNNKWEVLISGAKLNRETLKENMQKFISAFTVNSPSEQLPSFIKTTDQVLGLGITSPKPMLTHDPNAYEF